MTFLKITAQKIIIAFLSVSLFSIAFSTHAQEDGSGWDFDPAPIYKSADGQFEFDVRGRLQYDFGDVDDRDGLIQSQDSEFRRIRLGVDGIIFGKVEYSVIAGFEGDDTTLRSGYLVYRTGDVSFQLGHFKPSNSFDEFTSSTGHPVAERAAFTDVYELTERWGGEVKYFGEGWVGQLGAFKGNANVGNNGGEWNFAGRAFAYPTMNGTLVHISTHFRHASRKDDDANFRYRQREFSHLANTRLLDTGAFADKEILFGGEMIAIRDQFSFGGEWVFSESEVSNTNTLGLTPGDKIGFNGGYVGLTANLTGEDIRYSKSSGAFSSPRVAQSVFDGGIGLFQAALRYDRMDLTDGPVDGGIQDSLIVGLTWYPHDKLFVMFSASRNWVKGGPFSPTFGPDGKDVANTWLVRLQAKW